LDGTTNTRDLGGLPAAGGMVRRGLLIRSDALCALDAGDVANLRDRGVQSVLDLRLPWEVLNQGIDRYQGAHHVSLPMTYRHAHWGAEAYEGYLMQNPRSVKGFFDALTAPDGLPVVFHCVKGKDRTGIMSALVLEVLGTPRGAIMNDYLCSEEADGPTAVDASWLQRVFDLVDAGGGIETFLGARGVTGEQLTALRARCVEPAGGSQAGNNIVETACYSPGRQV
jgi:protein-tyrosine phosphatase